MSAGPTLASRTELAQHEPPRKPTQRHAGPCPTASRNRSPSASVPQPSFETGVSTPSMPVIAVTAATSACATAACDTMTPRSSLIVFLEVLLRPALVAHPANQPLVEPVGGSDAAVAEEMVRGDPFADNRQILPGVQRHRHERQRHVEQLGLLLIEPGAIVLARVVPVLELDDDFDALLLADRADAEQRVDVDQPDTADFHVVAGDFVPAADQHVVPAPRHVHRSEEHTSELQS